MVFTPKGGSNECGGGIKRLRFISVVLRLLLPLSLGMPYWPGCVSGWGEWGERGEPRTVTVSERWRWGGNSNGEQRYVVAFATVHVQHAGGGTQLSRGGSASTVVVSAGASATTGRCRPPSGTLAANISHFFPAYLTWYLFCVFKCSSEEDFILIVNRNTRS